MMGELMHITDEMLVERDGLIPKHVMTCGQLGVAEAEGIHRVTVKYLAARPTRRQAPFTFAWAVQLHREMFRTVWRCAGEVRVGELNVGASLRGLMDDVVYSRDTPGGDVAEQAVVLHHRAVRISPFQGGNGRWARMMSNIYLRHMGAEITVWPESVVRDEYAAAMLAADDQDYDLLKELHRRFAA